MSYCSRRPMPFCLHPSTNASPPACLPLHASDTQPPSHARCAHSARRCPTRSAHARCVVCACAACVAAGRAGLRRLVRACGPLLLLLLPTVACLLRCAPLCRPVLLVYRGARGVLGEGAAVVQGGNAIYIFPYALAIISIMSTTFVGNSKLGMLHNANSSAGVRPAPRSAHTQRGGALHPPCRVAERRRQRRHCKLTLSPCLRRTRATPSVRVWPLHASDAQPPSHARRRARRARRCPMRSRLGHVRWWAVWGCGA